MNMLGTSTHGYPPTGGKKEPEAATSSEASIPAHGGISEANLVVPIYQTKMVVPAPPTESSCSLGHPLEDQMCDVDAAEKLPSDTISESTVFQPVTQRSHREQDSGDDIQILSPDSATSPTDSLCESGSSTDLQDSLNHTDVLGSSQRAEFEKHYIVRKPHRRTMSERGSQVAHVQVPGVVTDALDKNTHPSSASQLQRRPQASTLYTDSDSSSSTNSLCHYFHHRPTPPRSRGRSRSTPACRGLSTGEQVQPQFNKEPSEIKSATVTENRIVGILKKPESSQQDSKVSSAASTACSSHMSSAAGSMLIGNGGSQISSRGTEDGGVRALKRVRFVDQDQSSSGHKGRASSPTTTPLDAARTELWNRVLPNGLSTPFPPNSAFTPRMKVSLSPKSSLSVTGHSKPPSTPLNGLVVHVPRATVDNSPSPECRSPEHGVAVNSNLVKGNNPVSSSPVPHSPTTDCLEEDQVSESPMQLRKDSTAYSSTSKRDHIADDQHGPSASEYGRNKLNRIQRPIGLERTPTDDDINDLWDQIRRCLHTNEKITVPPQVFNFKLQPQDMAASQPQNEGQRVFVTLPARQQPQLARKAGSVTHQKHVQESGSPAHGQKQLVYRQSSRPLRCQHELHHPVRLWKRQNEAVHVRHPAAKDPDIGKSSTGSGSGRKGRHAARFHTPV